VVTNYEGSRDVQVPLDTTLMGLDTIHGQRPKMVVQHQDRFWMSNCFNDSH
jgi:hypothetical protein